MRLIFEFDPEKDAINKGKAWHIAADAELFDWNDLHVEPDVRRDYGEARYVAYGFLNGRLHAMVFARRSHGRELLISQSKQT